MTAVMNLPRKAVLLSKTLARKERFLQTAAILVASLLVPTHCRAEKIRLRSDVSSVCGIIRKRCYLTNNLRKCQLCLRVLLIRVSLERPEQDLVKNLWKCDTKLKYWTVFNINGRGNDLINNGSGLR